MLTVKQYRPQPSQLHLNIKLTKLIPQIYHYHSIIGCLNWTMIGFCRRKMSASCCVLMALIFQHYHALSLSPTNIPTKELISHLHLLNELNKTNPSNSRLNFEFGLTLQLLAEKGEKERSCLQDNNISTHLTAGIISSLDPRHLIQKAQESYLRYLGEVRVAQKKQSYFCYSNLTLKRRNTHQESQ
mmetsp:Transcript_13183/g.27904  ORF Transcript_13183/g.27904 Transcript_13183/m.27904 type:complete len:186 (+) Transcript_13183:2582-3139(+)